MKTTKLEMFLRGFACRWGKKLARCSLVFEGAWNHDLPPAWAQAKGRPFREIRVLDGDGKVQFMEQYPRCTVSDRKIVLALRLEWPLALNPPAGLTEAEQRARAAEVSGDLAVLGCIFAGQALGDPVWCEADVADYPVRGREVLPFESLTEAE